MDALDSILSQISLKSVIYFKSDFASPWGMEIPDGPFAQFHIVVRGQCLLRIGKKTIRMFAGDIVMFPLGTSHWLADSSESKRENGKKVVESIMCQQPIFAGEGISATLVCGHFEFDRNLNHPFISSLPEVIYVSDSDRRRLPWLRNVVDLIIHEKEINATGNQTVIDKLGEVLFVHALRAHILSEENERGFLTALRDERIGQSLKFIHLSPEKDWKLEILAKEVGMSRTAFINKFKQLVGDTPSNYITKCRILKAKEILKDSKSSVAEVAAMVGYGSEAAFSRVFKKHASHSPLKFRRVFA